MSSGLRVTFLGGAETVTGSQFLVESDKGKLLIDCGIEQGRDFSAERAYAPFGFNPGSIDALVVTHAHLDHVGLIPKLVRDGFTGKIYMTPPTKDLAELILHDSISILAQDAKQHGRPPLYEAEDVRRAFALVEALPYHTEKMVAPGLSVSLGNTGHILGSASVHVKADDGTTMAFTGDIGNSPSPYLADPEPITDADCVFMESVYGDRVHRERENRTGVLETALVEAIDRGGAILMPAFSMERTQLMLYEISKLFETYAIPRIPVFLDSPLAISVTEVYKKYENTEYLNHQGDLFSFPFVMKTKSREESEEIEKAPNPKLIIAGAGMSHGGRIGRWEQKYLPDAKTTLFIVGYQAPGSPGRMLEEGAPRVRLDREWVTVRAKVVTLTSWSAHADRDGLLAFAEKCLPRTKNFFVGLGEPAGERFLAQRIHDYLGVKATVPTTGEIWEIQKDKVRKI